MLTDAELNHYQALDVEPPAEHIEALYDQCREANALRHRVTELEAENADLRAKQATLISALRGEQGILFSEDGYEVNVAALKDESSRNRAMAGLADEIAAAYRETNALWQWQSDWLARYAAAKEKTSG